MTQTTNVIAQVLITIAQILNVFLPDVSGDLQPVATTGMAFLQAIIAFIAQRYNPDGTKAAAPYLKK